MRETRWHVRFVCPDDRAVEGSFRFTTQKEQDEDIQSALVQYLRDLRFLPPTENAQDYLDKRGIKVLRLRRHIIVLQIPRCEGPTFRGKRLREGSRTARFVAKVLAGTLTGAAALGGVVWTLKKKRNRKQTAEPLK